MKIRRTIQTSRKTDNWRLIDQIEDAAGAVSMSLNEDLINSFYKGNKIILVSMCT